MRRRHFIAGLGGAVIWPAALAASRSPIIGVLSSNTADEQVEQAFRSGLAEFGYKVGRNVEIEYRYAAGNYDQLRRLADELAAMAVDIIVTVPTYPAAAAAKAATTTIPVIFLTGVDPVQLGLVQAINRPGGNLTGIAIQADELAAKRIELFHQLLPASVPIAVMEYSPTPVAAEAFKAAEETVRRLGREFIAVPVSSVLEIEDAFVAVREKKAGLVVWQEGFFTANRVRIVSLAEHYSVICIYGPRLFAEIGGLISYGANTSEMYRLLGGYAAKVLNGAVPETLPVMQPTKYELVINMKTARAQGVTIPNALLAAADEVIE